MKITKRFLLENINIHGLLYHVTNIKNKNSIVKYGLFPEFGKTIRDAYNQEYDFDTRKSYQTGDYNENDERRYIDFHGLIFFQMNQNSSTATLDSKETPTSAGMIYWYVLLNPTMKYSTT